MIEEEHLRWNENGVINRMTSLVIKNNGVLVVPAPVPLIVKRRCNQRSFRLWALLPWLDGVSVRSSIRGGCCRLWWCWCRWSFTETTNVTLLCCSSVRFYVNKTRFQFCNPSKGLWRHSINATNVSIISQQYGEPVHVVPWNAGYNEADLVRPHPCHVIHMQQSWRHPQFQITKFKLLYYSTIQNIIVSHNLTP